MEEFVGGLWHRFITRTASRSHPQAAVRLEDIERTAGVLFRAMGGDPGLRVTAAAEVEHGGRRRWLARLAHIDDRAAQASLDDETLRLPPEIAVFPDPSHNRDLYLWLIAQAAGLPPVNDSWIAANQAATRATLERYPGLAARYRRIAEACVAARIAPERMPTDEAAAEQAIRRAILEPGTVDALPPARKPPQPVVLWLYPTPQALDNRKDKRQPNPQDSEDSGGKSQDGSQKRRRAERNDMPDASNAFILPFHTERLLSFAEYVKVNRALDDDENDDAAKAATDMDTLSVASDGSNTASKVRFDLDLPSEAHDDFPLADGILLPEWDWKKKQLKKNHCSLVLLDPRDATACPLPARLARPARRLRSQFESLAPSRRWLKNQPEGSELDMDACVRAWTDRQAGHHTGASGNYLSCERHERDLACLVLADLSLSTDAWVGNEARVIDVIKDSLMLFSEALGATGDSFGLYGFSSRRRDHIRFHRIKDFTEKYGAVPRGRIAALKPGYYTRMGAAIRHSSALLARQRNALRLLLILSDGKPNDLDHYEGRYGIEDTRMALIEARNMGLRPFCVTIDKEGAGYLPHLFGPAGYTVIRKPEELPSRLPLLYAQLTAS
ncbi:MAG: nitric oxide reductase [Zoogloeaceae bacterium]|nr:nitric oxide reductase [Zoogloeaceae bacterium]MCP5255800.1 nitric oxide reductase [Zoogloeaceae bacterium]